jgi:DNA polymerase IV
MRTIFHVDMDAFFVSVEELHDPSLRGKPVVVGGRPDERGVVSAASYEARKFGVHSAMPLRTAYKLCPEAIFVDGHMERYREASLKVEAVLRDFSPQVEMASIDEAYLDMTGTERLHGPPLRAADALHEQVRQRTELRCSIGIATSRMVAKVASDMAKRNGVLWVVPDCEAGFLAPLEVRKIPGVGKVMEKNLHELGIKTIGDLAKLDEGFLEERFGKWGLALAGKARGEDAGAWFSDEVAYSDTVELPKSISHEHTFSTDTRDQTAIESTLSRLSEKVARRLREQAAEEGGWRARNVALKLRFADFTTLTRARTLESPTHQDPEIFAIIREMFRANWTQPGSKQRPAVRLVGVKLADFVQGEANAPSAEAQLSLLPEPAPPASATNVAPPEASKARWDKALAAADKLRDKFGEGAIGLAGGMRGQYRERAHEAMIVERKKPEKE